MTTDKTPATLATVKHGGCVQLGDGLLPCPFCGNGAEFVPYKNNGLTLKCKSMGCIQRHQRTLRYGIEWLRTSMTEHWNARALSAQPSPGGQDALAAIDRLLAHVESLGASQIHPDYVQDARTARAALAARQPVCATVKDSLTVGGGQPVGDEERAETYRKGWEAGNAAQAVDLAEFKALYRAYVRLLESGRDRIIDLGGTCDPVDVMEANDVDLQAARRVLDSQAVGK